MTWWFVLFAVLGGPATLVLHETCHYLVIKAFWGSDVAAFTPWPHKGKSGWYFGCTTPTARLGPLAAVSHLAPLVKAMILIPWCLFLCAVLDWWHPVPLAVWEAIDFGWWWRGWFGRLPRSDGGKLRVLAEGETT